MNDKHDKPMADAKTGKLIFTATETSAPPFSVIGLSPPSWTREQKQKAMKGPPSMVPDVAEQERAKERAHAAEGPHKPKEGKKYKVTVLSTEVRPAERNDSPIKLMVNGESLEVPRNQELVLDESWLEALKNSEFGQDVRAFPA